jgi:hypothetical protein
MAFGRSDTADLEFRFHIVLNKEYSDSPLFCEANKGGIPKPMRVAKINCRVDDKVINHVE